MCFFNYVSTQTHIKASEHTTFYGIILICLFYSLTVGLLYSLISSLFAAQTVKLLFTHLSPVLTHCSGHVLDAQRARLALADAAECQHIRQTDCVPENYSNTK